KIFKGIARTLYEQAMIALPVPANNVEQAIPVRIQHRYPTRILHRIVYSHLFRDIHERTVAIIAKQEIWSVLVADENIHSRCDQRQRQRTTPARDFVQVGIRRSILKSSIFVQFIQTHW